MGVVHEVIDFFPFDQPARIVRRREDLLLAEAAPGLLSDWADPSPVEAIRRPTEWAASDFGPPAGIYESEHVRLERQSMNNRQSFFHRNLDVDELSYQVRGTRTLMSELGSVDLEEGDYSRLPVGVAHDNYGREDIHLLFYIPAHVEEARPPTRQSELQIPPFDGWEPSAHNEVFGEGLGSADGVVGAFPTDEQMLLEEAGHHTERVAVLRADAEPGTTWLYTSPEVWVGETHLADDDGRTYRRHLNCDEVQYQISGQRTLVTQRGSLHLEPGDFVRIPKGMAFTSISLAPSEHITLVSRPPLPQVTDGTAKGERLSVEQLDELRRR